MGQIEVHSFTVYKICMKHNISVSKSYYFLHDKSFLCGHIEATI